MRIGERSIGAGHPCFIIAEAGSNHNGELETAYRLIDAAVAGRADAVKFQLFRAAKLYPRSAGQAGYLNAGKSIFEIISELEVPDEWIPKLAARCREAKIQFMCTPFDEDSADVLAPHVPAFKIASYEMTHIPLLRHCARFGKPMIVSTGTADLAEVHTSVDAIRRAGNHEIVLLQCTASYPAPLAHANVRALVTLRESTGLAAGLSDHTADPLIAPVVAAALGAVVIEKHFTLDRAMPGPDHQYAITPGELAAMVTAIRSAEAALGHGRKEVLPVERELHQFARRTIFATRPIAAGEALSREDLAVLRCGRHAMGFSPGQLEDVVGRRAIHAIPEGRPLQPEDLV